MPKFYGNSIDATPEMIKNLTSLGYTYTNNPSEVSSGDLVLGGAGATGGVADNKLNGATRLYGNDRAGTAAAIQGFIQSKQTPSSNVDIASMIQQQAAQATAAKLAAIQKAKEQAINGYNEQIASTPAQYQPLRNQAAVNKETSLLANKEQMASTGRFFSGDNLTEQGKINNQFAGDVNSANMQQQAFIDKLKNAIAQVNENSAYDSAQAVADSEASKLSALINQANSDREYGLNKRQVDWNEDTVNNPTLAGEVIKNKYLPSQYESSIAGQNLNNEGQKIQNEINNLTLKYQPQILKGQIDEQTLKNNYQQLVNAGYNKSLAADLAYKAAETAAVNRSYSSSGGSGGGYSRRSSGGSSSGKQSSAEINAARNDNINAATSYVTKMVYTNNSSSAGALKTLSKNKGTILEGLQNAGMSAKDALAYWQSMYKDLSGK
jgi:hypothetical protein